MRHGQYIVAFLLASLWAGAACAYPAGVYRDNVVVVQQRVVLARAGAIVVQQEPRPRRFVMPPGAVYQRGTVPQQYALPPQAPRATRMTLEERRALRQQINDANRGIYYRNDYRSGSRVVRP